YFKVPKAFRPQLFTRYPLTDQDSIYETIFCRGGFHQKNLTITNNLDKPAPTPRIIHINLIFALNSQM
ncbi:hypothetical protein QUA08_10895, partial [Microcoleus sp. T3B2]|uniref:hypothetical protein n=1 Tax=Microcoleus sp. T3B2 TaxID=3055426 RepID=UPI002FD484CE